MQVLHCCFDPNSISTPFDLVQRLCRRSGCGSFIRDCGHIQPGEELEGLLARLAQDKQRRRLFRDSEPRVGKSDKKIVRGKTDSLMLLNKPLIARPETAERVGRKGFPQHRLQRRQHRRETEHRNIASRAILDLDEFSSLIPVSFLRTFPSRQKSVPQKSVTFSHESSYDTSDAMSMNDDDEEFIPATVVAQRSISASNVSAYGSRGLPDGFVVAAPFHGANYQPLSTSHREGALMDITNGDSGVLCDLPKVSIKASEQVPLKEIFVNNIDSSNAISTVLPAQRRTTGRTSDRDVVEVVEPSWGQGRISANHRALSGVLAIKTDPDIEIESAHTIVDSSEVVASRSAEFQIEVDAAEEIEKLLNVLKGANENFVLLSERCRLYAVRCKDIWEKFKSASQRKVLNSILILSSDFELFRLQLEREVNDVFNEAYTKLKRLFWGEMSRPQKKARKSFGLLHDMHLAELAHIEPKIKDHIKKLEVHFKLLYGTFVEDPISAEFDDNDVSVNAQAKSTRAHRSRDSSDEEDEWEGAIDQAASIAGRVKGSAAFMAQPTGLLEHPRPPAKRRRRVESRPPDSKVTADDVYDIAGFVVESDEGDLNASVDYNLFDLVREKEIHNGEEMRLARFYKNKYLKNRVQYTDEDMKDESCNIGGPEVSHKVDPSYRLDDLLVKNTLKRPIDVIDQFLNTIGTSRCNTSAFESCWHHWQLLVVARLNIEGSEHSDAISAENLFDMFTKDQIAVLRDANILTGAGRSPDERTLLSWQRVTRRLFQRLLSDLCDETAASVFSRSFDESGSSTKNATYANTFRVISLLRSLKVTISSVEQQFLAGIGGVTGLFEYFYQECLQYEVAAVDRISSLLNCGDSRERPSRLAAVATIKFVKYLNVKLTLLCTAAANPIISFAFDGLIQSLINRFWHILTYFSNFYTSLLANGMSELIELLNESDTKVTEPGSELILFWWRLLQAEAKADVKYTQRPEAAWRSATDHAFSWLLNQRPIISSTNLYTQHLPNIFIGDVSAEGSYPKVPVVDPQASLWLWLTVHTAALYLNEYAAERACGRTAANWQAVRVLFANPVPSSLNAALEALPLANAYFLRLVALGRLWDNFSECFEFWVELSVRSLSEFSLCERNTTISVVKKLTYKRIFQAVQRAQYFCSALSCNDADESVNSALKHLFQYTLALFPVVFPEEGDGVLILKCAELFGKLLKAAIDGLSKVGVKRIINKICSDGGMLSFMVKDGGENRVGATLLSIFFLSEAVSVFGGSSILIDGELSQRISKDLFCTVPLPSYLDNCIMSIVLVKVSLPWVVAQCRNTDQINESDTLLASLYIAWFTAFLQNVNSGNCGALYPVIISLICPLAQLLVKNEMFLSNQMQVSISKDLPGIKLFTLLTGALNTVLSREHGNALDEMFPFAMKCSLMVLDSLKAVGRKRSENIYFSCCSCQ